MAEADAMGMMESAHAAVGFAGGLVAAVFIVCIALYVWATRRR
jgi:hypothetical protein